MDFFIKFLTETIEGINQLIECKQYFVNVKILRHILNIKSSDRTKINFHWRNLQLLERKKIITLYSNKSPTKLYKLPKSKIDIDRFIESLAKKT